MEGVDILVHVSMLAQVPDSERTLIGPLHRGYYRGHCLAGDDLLEAVGLPLQDLLLLAQRLHPLRVHHPPRA